MMPAATKLAKRSEKPNKSRGVVRGIMYKQNETRESPKCIIFKVVRLFRSHIHFMCSFRRIKKPESYLCDEF